MLTKLAGSLRRWGAAPETILETLRNENARRCCPPLSDAEIRQIAQGILRYRPAYWGAAAAAAAPERPGEGSAPGRRERPALAALRLAQERLTLFHDAQRIAYAAAATDGETWRIGSKALRACLTSPQRRKA